MGGAAGVATVAASCWRPQKDLRRGVEAIAWRRAERGAASKCWVGRRPCLRGWAVSCAGVGRSAVKEVAEIEESK